MANFCSNCGAEAKLGAKFCEHCGSKLVQNEVPQPQTITVENDNPYRRSSTVGGSSMGGTGTQQESGWTERPYNPFPESGLSAQFFTMKGRLNRWRYFKRCCAIFGIAFVLIIISAILIGTNHAVMGGLAIVAIIIGAQIASICLVVRRFHDMEPANNTDNNFMVKRMGAYIGFALAQGVWDWAWILNSLMSLYLLFNTGVKGANRHGADPLEH